ncbi:DedA family protein [Streptomyces sp. DSM 40907]|uniref:DedA family protein n=1 Tax=Streptomyces kutzneri TaxID=3051179 RepID=UPI0028D846E1|nr:VTT domain-containing protein [Streptomyces sp. DSM 40907]
MSEWSDQTAEVLRGTLDSPWPWLVLFAVIGLGGLIPFMPSQTGVVTVGTLIGPDPGMLALLALLGACAALLGDCLGYGLGRFAGPRTRSRLLRGERGSRLLARAHHLVERHGTALVVAGRFLPGGRVSSTLASGSLSFPPRRFVALDALGAAAWAVYVTALGGLGGAGLTHDPLTGLLLATGVGTVISVCVARRRGMSADASGPGR